MTIRYDYDFYRHLAQETFYLGMMSSVSVTKKFKWENVINQFVFEAKKLLNTGALHKSYNS